MKTIIFKQIAIKNFLSIGSNHVVVDFKTGLNIITGSNKDKDDSRNGVGKSTIADAIYYAVFGNTLRDIKKENVSNDSSKGSCEVQLTLDIISESETQSVHILRKLDPSKVELTINGMDKTRDSIANTNENIAQLLSCNPEVFENCVIMTLNNALPFMCRKKQDKRKFIESIFNLEIFSKMLINVKADYAEYKNQLDVEVAKKNQIETTIKSLETQEKNASNEKQIKLTKINAKLDDATRRQKTLKEKQDTFDGTSLITEKTSNQTKLDNVEPTRVSLNNILNNVSETKKKIEDELAAIRLDISKQNGIITHTQSNLNKIDCSSPTCPVCLRAITEEDISHIKDEKAKLQIEIDAAKKTILCLNAKKDELDKKINGENNTISDVNGRLTKLKTIERDLKDKIQKITDSQLEINQLQQKIDLIDVELEGYKQTLISIQDESVSFSSVIQDQKTNLLGVVAEVDRVKFKIALLDKVKFVFSEEGVKSFLVKQILDLFNNRLGYYLQKMDANCICSFNEYFEETIINDKNKVYSYFNFSGAERKKLDLACLFTFMDIRRLQGDVSFNISLYDELLDSSLDAKGVELVVNILKERVEKYYECIYIISHRKESTKLATGDVIYLQKNNGITTRVDFNQTPI
jgi:DNA repair exonuclease SbcCD ATPase subunit